MRLLVVGGSGFTGSRVLAACDPAWSVVGLARSERAAAKIRAANATVVSGDLDRPGELAGVIRSVAPDVVICTASLGFGHAPGLVEALVEAGSPYTVFTGTTGIFTRLSPASKQIRLDAESLITGSGLPFTIVRPTMIYGRPGDRNMERLLRWLARVPVVVAPGGGRALQQPVHVDDLATALLAAAAAQPAGGLTVNVPGPTPLSFADIVHQAGAALGRRARVVPVPLAPLRVVTGWQERVLPHPWFKTEQIDRLVEDKAFDGSEAERLLGHQPRDFIVGITEEARLLGLVSG